MRGVDSEDHGPFIVMLDKKAFALAVAVTALATAAPAWAQSVTEELTGEYSVSLVEGTDIRLEGDISHEAVGEVRNLLLSNEGVEVLVLNSAGGFVDAGFELVELVEERGLVVMAMGECHSACTLPLLASGSPSVVEGTVIGFHRWSRSTDVDVETQDEMDDGLRRFLSARGADEDVISKVLATGPDDLWTPSLRDLADQKLIRYVFDIDDWTYVDADAWCDANPTACDAE